MTRTFSLFFSIFFLFFHVNSAFNITKILTQFSDFTTFNHYLTKTGVAAEINSRSTLTVFVFNNGAASILPILRPESAVNILRAHVVLDYYNIRRLQSIPNRTNTLTTLFQFTGRAIGKQGLLNVTVSNSGVLAIGSAVEGAPANSKLVKPVLLQPYDISILQISDVIIPLGITNSSSAPSPMNSLPPSPTPSAFPVKPFSPSPTPRNSLPPSPNPARKSLPPSPRKSLSPAGEATDQSASSTSAPSNLPSTEKLPATPPSIAPINIIDALPSPPKDNSSTKMGTTLWLTVVAMMIILAITLYVI